MLATASKVALRRQPSSLAVVTVKTDIFAVGQNWTGSWGTPSNTKIIPGHDDNDDGTSEPELIWSNRHSNDELYSCSTFWGHSGMVVGDERGETRLLWTGRPHEFVSLIRLYKLPVWLRQYAVGKTLSSVRDKTPLFIESILDFFIDVYSIFAPEKDSFMAKDWERAKANSFMSTWSHLSVPDLETGDSVEQVLCGAGTTAILTKQGRLYMCGLNEAGQCGIGELNTDATARNVWDPTEVLLDDDDTIQSVGLTLNSGIILTTSGMVYTWGKSDRGCLGIGPGTVEYNGPVHVGEGMLLLPKRPNKFRLGPGDVIQIAAGLLHCAALTRDNRVLVWGKYQLGYENYGNENNEMIQDAFWPLQVKNLPGTIVQITCGSHHTSVLTDDGKVYAVGLAKDSQRPVETPVCLYDPADNGDIRIDTIYSSMDRTTMIGDNGRLVLQAQLWKDPILQQQACFSPNWVETILQKDERYRVKAVYRGWLHSFAIVEWDDIQEPV